MNTPAPDTGHLPPLAVELLLAGGAPGESGQRWQRHLEGCAVCAARLSDARALGESWQDSPAAAQVPGRLARAKVRPARRRRWWLAGLALPAAALAVWIWMRPPPPVIDSAKGGGVLGVIIERQGRSWPAAVENAAAEPLRSGDRVQLTWAAADKGQLALLGRDADGDVHLLFPAGGSASAAWPPGPARPAGASVMVDPAFRPLRVWAVFAPARFDLTSLIEGLRARGSLPAPAGAQVRFIDLAAGGAPTR